MSLDVYLTTKETRLALPAIYVREDGQVKSITRSEWDVLYPDREPVMTDLRETNEVYHDNITHNLIKMALEAGLYMPLWEPRTIGLDKAKQLIQPLHRGLELLRDKPEHFKKFNPENGWGDYDGLVEFVENYLKACKEYPDAEVSVSR